MSSAGTEEEYTCIQNTELLHVIINLIPIRFMHVVGQWFKITFNETQDILTLGNATCTLMLYI